LVTDMITGTPTLLDKFDDILFQVKKLRQGLVEASKNQRQTE